MDGQEGAGAEKQGKKLHTAEFKAKVMREHLEGGVALSDLAEKYQVHINSLYLWKKQLFENVADVCRGPEPFPSQGQNVSPAWGHKYSPPRAKSIPQVGP